MKVRQDSGWLLLGSNARLKQSLLHTGAEREKEGIQQWALRWLKKDKGRWYKAIGMRIDRGRASINIPWLWNIRTSPNKDTLP